jgi:hypothetical protein
MSNKTLPGVEIALSAKGLENLPNNFYETDFTFIIGESCYQRPSFHNSTMNDSTIREFHIENA